MVEGCPIRRYGGLAVEIDVVTARPESIRFYRPERRRVIIEHLREKQPEWLSRNLPRMQQYLED